MSQDPVAERHEWKDPADFLCVVERSPAGQYGTSYECADGEVRPCSPDFLDWLPEMVRLASRVQLLETEIEGRVLMREEDLARNTALVERERKLREALGPVLAAFRDRAAAWDRMRERGGCGEMAPRITLTAEFDVEALRALLKEE